MSSSEPSITDIRKYKAHSYESFVFKNTCLLKTIRVKKSHDLRGMLFVINGVELEPSSVTGSHYVFDFKLIREKIRALFGFTKEENDLLRLEETLGYNQFLAMNYYSKLPREHFSNSVFTSALQIAFRPKIFTKNDTLSIDVEEEFFKPTPKTA